MRKNVIKKNLYTYREQISEIQETPEKIKINFLYTDSVSATILTQSEIQCAMCEETYQNLFDK
jgi:hypothetical protein